MDPDLKVVFLTSVYASSLGIVEARASCAIAVDRAVCRRWSVLCGL